MSFAAVDQTLSILSGLITVIFTSIISIIFIYKTNNKLKSDPSSINKPFIILAIFLFLATLIGNLILLIIYLMNTSYLYLNIIGGIFIYLSYTLNDIFLVYRLFNIFQNGEQKISSICISFQILLCCIECVFLLLVCFAWFYLQRSIISFLMFAAFLLCVLLSVSLNTLQFNQRLFYILMKDLTVDHQKRILNLTVEDSLLIVKKSDEVENGERDLMISSSVNGLQPRQQTLISMITKYSLLNILLLICLMLTFIACISWMPYLDFTENVKDIKYIEHYVIYDWRLGPILWLIIDISFFVNSMMNVCLMYLSFEMNKREYDVCCFWCHRKLGGVCEKIALSKIEEQS